MLHNLLTSQYTYCICTSFMDTHNKSAEKTTAKTFTKKELGHGSPVFFSLAYQRFCTDPSTSCCLFVYLLLLS